MIPALIVDDEIEAIHGLISHISWKKLGISPVNYATCIENAKTIFTQYSSRIILCDIEIPDGSGLDFLEWVRERDESARFIILTCHEEFAYAQRAITLSCTDYIIKPIPYEELESKLSDLISRFFREQGNAENKDMVPRNRGDALSRSDSSDSSSKRISLSAYKTVEKVKEYILNNLQSEIRVETLAHQFYLSPDYLSKIFRCEEGISISEYVTAKRMMKAGKLLEQSDLSISRIAYECGIDNFSYFTKVFRKTYGCTPREYRLRR